MHNLLEQHAGSDALRELGLVHRYPLHIDVANNETGFAVYVAQPAAPNTVWQPLFWYQPNQVNLELNYDFFDTYLRIREVGDNGVVGQWHTMPVSLFRFTQNTPPAVLDQAGFGRFDSVTWLEGLVEDRKYQVQGWVDLYENGRLDSVDFYSGIHNINTDPDAFNVDINGDGTMDFFIS